ncbi:GFA family protein [Catenovulum sediminis]|uniref:GFA family protein n=1 Tax=Catenovulum sediminis TaxID=1740262 RepID=A0ABV1RMT1_9ALTE|nr:GFA family protein [Catenovulum sediminis]
MKGSCLCNQVQFEVQPPVQLFQYCHCSRCRKVTGSAHASNLYAKNSQLIWLKGEDLVQRYEVPDAKYFATCFCKHCGSALPWTVKGRDTLVIPAGSLDEDLDTTPLQSIHWASKANWYTSPNSIPHFDELPPKK